MSTSDLPGQIQDYMNVCCRKAHRVLPQSSCGSFPFVLLLCPLSLDYIAAFCPVTQLGLTFLPCDASM
jgi:hypothetical protein